VVVAFLCQAVAQCVTMPVVTRSVELLSSLKQAPYNPRKISDKALKGLRASIDRWGIVQDIVVNQRSGFIVGGHQRVAALKVAGVKEVPVCWVDLDEPEERALNVALNNPHTAGEFASSLQTLLAEIQDGIGPELFSHLALDGLLDAPVPDFGQGSEDDQGRLDELSPKMVKCPGCGQSFDARKHEG